MSVNVDIAPLPETVRPPRPWDAPTTKVGRSRERLAWLLVTPSLLVVLIVALYPLIQTFRLSFTNTRLASAREPRFVGLDNYATIFRDASFLRALTNTAVFAAAFVLLPELQGHLQGHLDRG